MSDRRIEDVIHDTIVTGTEKVPVSDAGVAKFVTVDQFKDFVLSKIAEVGTSADINVETDGIYILKGGSLRKIGAETLIGSAVSFLFGGDAIDSLVGTDSVVVRSGGQNRVATVAQIAEYVANAIESLPVDISSLNTLEGDVETQYDVAVANGSTTYKSSVLKVLKCVLKNINSAGVETAYSSGQGCSALVIDPNNNNEVRKVAVSSMVEAHTGGKVNGPSANTDGRIPQWDGANSKTLKDGLSVVEEINSSSTSTQVPTAAAVEQRIEEAIDEAGDVHGPDSSTDGDIAQFDGASGKAIKGGYRIVNETPTSTERSSSLMTSMAVLDEMSHYARKVESPATGGTLAGYNSGRVFPAETVTALINESSPSTTKIPTEYAVATALGTCVRPSGTPVAGKLAKWRGPKSVEQGPGIDEQGNSQVPVIGSTSTDSSVPTSKAVYEHSKKFIEKDEVSPLPQSAEARIVVSSMGHFKAQLGPSFTLDVGEDLEDASIPSEFWVIAEIGRNALVHRVSTVEEAKSSTKVGLFLCSNDPNSVYYRVTTSSGLYKVQGTLVS